MREILITGGSGFIGKNLYEYLLGRYKVHCPSRKELNLEDKEQVEKYLLKTHYDVVIHCANTNDVTNNLSHYDILDKNIRMFLNLEACRSMYGKMLYFGSGAEYDCEHYVPMMKEEYIGTYIPKDPYGFAKYVISHTSRDKENIYELILFGVYGKYEQYQRRFISNNICRSLAGMPLSINQNVYFDYIYIDDLCKIVEWFIENKPHYNKYNVCTSSVIDLYSLAELINQVMGLDRQIIIKGDGLKKEYSGSNARMFREIGTFDFYDRAAAIKEMVHYYKENWSDINMSLIQV